MNRIPPNLLYIAIFNPTLKPLGTIPDGDEDAEEQAHILFYTARERAVSRDQMLRQVGLAKALVNFSDMFNGVDMCNNVHSQSKRLIMVSPEPDFWIHAAVEVAKVPRVPADKSKTKPKDKPLKGNEKDINTAPSYDYQEGSVHDLALRADILRGYEQFKLTHGSFTSILSEIGKEGLELQLERFFTVWAWSWNLEDGAEFGEHLGISLHPSFPLIRTVLDNYSLQAPNHASSVFIKPPYVVPSPQYSAAKYPAALLRHLISLMPPAPLDSEDELHAGDKSRQPSDGDPPNGKDPPTATSTSSILSMPTVNMNIKWGWPASLTFGKGPSKRSVLEQPDESKDAGLPKDDAPSAISSSSTTEAVDHRAKDTDESSTHFAFPSMSSDHSISSTRDVVEAQGVLNEADESDTVETQSHSTPSIADVDATSTLSSAMIVTESTPTTQPPPVFSSITVHIARSPDTPFTHRQKVYYLINDRSMLALVGLDEATMTSNLDLPQSSLSLLENIETLLSEELTKTVTPDQLPTLSKILQPTDTHIVSAGQFTISSPNFASKSSHLYDAQELQALDPEISEVFSRGLNPQHWHIARRDLNPSAQDEHNLASAGQVYMQIFRKEATLSDVDNVLSGVVRRSGLADGAM